MPDQLDNQINGAVMKVTIRGAERPLEYRFAAVLAFQEKTGRSLFDRKVFLDLDPAKDPALWLACLWAGLHEQQPNGKWKAPYTFDELTGLIDFDPDGVQAISLEMVKALAARMPKAKDVAHPNAAAASESPQDPTTETTHYPTSSDSGRVRESVTDSPATSS